MRQSIFSPPLGFVREPDDVSVEGAEHVGEPWAVTLRLGDAAIFFSDETAVQVARALLRQVAENQGSDDVWATYRANIEAAAVAA